MNKQSQAWGFYGSKKISSGFLNSPYELTPLTSENKQIDIS